MMDDSGDLLPLIMLGAGGHAKVLLSLARASGLNVIGICDPALEQQAVAQWRGIAVLGGDEVLDSVDPASVGLVNCVGQLVGSSIRGRIFDRFKARGFSFPALVHPTAWIDPSVVLNEGAQVMAGAVVQADVIINCNSIINTGATLDHDCRIGANVHVAPGATLCGNVVVEDRAFIGSGATVIQGITVGEEAVVGAGVVLVRDLAPRLILIGPAARASIR